MKGVPGGVLEGPRHRFRLHEFLQEVVEGTTRRWARSWTFWARRGAWGEKPAAIREVVGEMIAPALEGLDLSE